MAELKLANHYQDRGTYEFELVDKDLGTIGLIQIRTNPSASSNLPLEMASHIYYEIKPEFREQGYGHELLRLGLVEAKQLGLDEVFITTYEDNHPSKKMIEKAGGILQSQIDVDGRKFLKYQVKI